MSGNELILKCFFELTEVRAGDDLGIVFEQDLVFSSYEDRHRYAHLTEKNELIFLGCLTREILAKKS